MLWMECSERNIACLVSVRPLHQRDGHVGHIPADLLDAVGLRLGLIHARSTSVRLSEADLVCPDHIKIVLKAEPCICADASQVT